VDSLPVVERKPFVVVEFFGVSPAPHIRVAKIGGFIIFYLKAVYLIKLLHELFVKYCASFQCLGEGDDVVLEDYKGDCNEGHAKVWNHFHLLILFKWSPEDFNLLYKIGKQKQGF